MQKIAIVAPSSQVPQAWVFRRGVKRLIEAGFSVWVHPQCKKSHIFFAGSDEDRAQALIDVVSHQQYSIILCARGGYGSARILPFLERHFKKAPHKKLLVGYSDSTALMEFVRKRWGWSVLHAPFPSQSEFLDCNRVDESSTLLSWLRGESIPLPSWSRTSLEVWSKPKKFQSVQGVLVGGNLSVWTSLVGTPYEGESDQKILFLEEVGEPFYRIDRMINQLFQSNGLKKIKAIFLGDFLNCHDLVRQVLKSPRGQLQPLRKPLGDQEGLKKIFQSIGEQLQIPVIAGLPVGHGPRFFALPLGVEYSFSLEEGLNLLTP